MLSLALGIDQLNKPNTRCASQVTRAEVLAAGALQKSAPVVYRACAAEHKQVVGRGCAADHRSRVPWYRAGTPLLQLRPRRRGARSRKLLLRWRLQERHRGL